MAPPLFIGSEIYRRSTYGALHPLRVPRVSTVIDLSRALGWLPPEVYVPSPRAKPETLIGWHTPQYIAALHAAEASQSVSEAVRLRHWLGTPSNPVFPEMYRRPATAAGGSLLAGELLAQGGIVYHPAGGTHHGIQTGRAGSAISMTRCWRSCPCAATARGAWLISTSMRTTRTGSRLHLQTRPMC